MSTITEAPVSKVKTSSIPASNESNEIPSSDVEILPEAVVAKELDTSTSEPNSNEIANSSAQSSVPETKPDFVRIKKKKVVLMLSYCGQDYYGMQKNPGMRTIEGDLFDSLLKNNYIDEETYNKPQLVGFQRAARTDKNVSAARQIISIKAPENIDIEKVNELLPKYIRIMGMKRVTKGFDSKTNCDARTYSYMLPTFAFAPVDAIVTKDYRISPEVLEEVRKTLAKYVGSKNYHNFTSRKRFSDPSAYRVIMSFICTDPFVEDGIEYVILRVKGQSFMMHQIRKMIGLVTAIMRGFASIDTMDKAWSSARIDIPRAPGVGLMLEEVHYSRYDDRYGKDGIHEVLTWDSLKPEVDAFCAEYIYPIVTKAEKEGSMMDWLSTLSYHSYDVRDRENEGEGGTRSPIGKAFSKVCRSSGVTEDEDEECGGDDDEDDRRVSGKRRKVAST